MGHSYKRIGEDVKPRYTAIFHDLAGIRRSAGTFATKRDADKAWHTAETKVAEGRLGDRRRGRQTFERYVRDTWLPNHQMEATTRERYTYTINRHLLPWFGSMRMMDVLPEHIREWRTHQTASGLSASSVGWRTAALHATTLERSNITPDR